MEVHIRSIVWFVVLFVIAYTNSTKVVPVSRRINGTKVVPVSRRINGIVTSVSDTNIFVMTVVGGIFSPDSRYSVAAYPKGGKCCDPQNGTDIVSPDSQPMDFFGWRIVSNSKFVAVSAEGYNHFNGAVFIYTVNEHKFTFQHKLLPDDGDYGDFGSSIAINDNNDIVIASRSGVYVFAFQNLKWIKLQKFSHSDVGCLDMSEDTIVVADGSNVSIYNRYDGVWTLTHTLTPPTHYGIYSVKLYNNRLYLGDPGSEKVYVYKPTWPWHQRWNLTQTITRAFGESLDWFGYSLAIYDNVMVVGAPDFERSTGIAYIFEYDIKRHMWVEKTQLKASDASSGDKFSDSVVMDSNLVFLSKEHDGKKPRLYTYVYEYKRTAEHMKKTLPH